MSGQSILKTEILADGFVFLEGPRWQNDRLWMSDMFGGKVYTLDLNGGVETVVDVPAQPSGLGFLPDGTPLIASMKDRRLLRLEDGAVLAYARGMMTWHRRHRFCGLCGAATRNGSAGHLRTCSNGDCATQHFPRTDPAVIMLVVDGGRCLLGRQARWPPGMYSTLAGFVEPGETLEAAVAREVHEEAGIEVAEVRYHSSQPWPFPGSIMLGFHAEALSTKIAINDEELEEARWFERAWIVENEGRPQPDGTTFRLPRKDSIARRLVEDWLDRGA